MEERMDTEFLGDRRRALEEEYFAKLNRALLERLRAREAGRYSEFLDGDAFPAGAAGHRAVRVKSVTKSA
jgi:hypothetical protein